MGSRGWEKIGSRGWDVGSRKDIKICIHYIPLPTPHLPSIYMDAIDKKILNIIQAKFPITSRPYQVIGDEIGIPEDEVIRRIGGLKSDGIIRRIGATFDPRRLGFKSSLCAAKVPSEKIDEFVRVVNSYPGVTHNYERDHGYNIWFTFIAESMEEIEKALQEIRERTGVDDIRNLPSLRFFKIRVDFDMEK